MRLDRKMQHFVTQRIKQQKKRLQDYPEKQENGISKNFRKEANGKQMYFVQSQSRMDTL